MPGRCPLRPPYLRSHCFATLDSLDMPDASNRLTRQTVVVHCTSPRDFRNLITSHTRHVVRLVVHNTLMYYCFWIDILKGCV